MDIRKAREEEIDNLLDLGEELYRVEKQFEPLLKYSKQDYKEKYESEIRKPDSLFLVAVENKEIVGYLYAHLDLVDYLNTDKKQCEIEVVLVKQEHQGKGIASALIKECIKWAQEKNAFRLVTGIYFKNKPSIELFIKNGFNEKHLTLQKML